MSEESGERPEMIELPPSEVLDVGRRAFLRIGTPADIADRVVGDLVANEIVGVRSHGILRLTDYLQDAAAGLLDVAARPAVTAPGGAVRVVDGQGGFGVLAADAVTANLYELLIGHPVCAVALTNAGHLGRLSAIGTAVARHGGAVLGFVNYLGAGQRVVPWQGEDGRLCTNPLLISVPAEPDPFVLDMSTSTVSEGRIRQHWLDGTTVPGGWLVDAAGAEVTDPDRLYSDPPTAFMTPLGGDHGYKGFALGVAVELLAGVISGAGYVRADTDRRGNGGLFIGISPALAGRAGDEVLREVGAVRSHLEASSPAVHWPGSGRTSGTDTIRLSQRRWLTLLAHADGKDPL
ncbi:Ldh family oxidoreductase [Kitasatospora sp. NPDC017646]|uniref:Ldh family oxidoreductase n=1 Tax=Kitasatospora sp. NPDC017646 TaxID=3364024 RepID=UPI0037B747C9